jgi:hypothetical protein
LRHAQAQTISLFFVLTLFISMPKPLSSILDLGLLSIEES